MSLVLMETLTITSIMLFHYKGLNIEVIPEYNINVDNDEQEVTVSCDSLSKYELIELFKFFKSKVKDNSKTAREKLIKKGLIR